MPEMHAAAVQQLQELLKHNVTLREAWIQTAAAQGARSRDELLSRFLWSDMNESSDGCLPHNWEVRGARRGKARSMPTSRYKHAAVVRQPRTRGHSAVRV